MLHGELWCAFCTVRALCRKPRSGFSVHFSKNVVAKGASRLDSSRIKPRRALCDHFLCLQGREERFQARNTAKWSESLLLGFLMGGITSSWLFLDGCGSSRFPHGRKRRFSVFAGWSAFGFVGRVVFGLADWDAFDFTAASPATSAPRSSQRQKPPFKGLFWRETPKNFHSSLNFFLTGQNTRHILANCNFLQICDVREGGTASWLKEKNPLRPAFIGIAEASRRFPTLWTSRI